MMRDQHWKWWLAAVVAGGLSATTKAPFFMSAGLTAFFWTWLRARNSARAWKFLISAGVISVLLFLAWNVHCHRVYAEAEFPTINLDPFDEHGGVIRWYIGNLGNRANLHNWLRGGWHLANSAFGGLGFIFLVLASTRFKASAEGWLWLLAAACTTLVFTQLVLGHTHYFFIFAPATAWLCAVAAAEIEPLVWDRLRLSIWMRGLVVSITLVASLAATLVATHFNLNFDPYPSEVAQLIKEHTSPGDKIVVWGMIWGDPFVKVDRQGLTGSLSLTDTSWLNDPHKLQRLKELGYKQIVLINLSPLVIAITSADGNHGEKLEDLHRCLPSVAQNWPVAFDSSAVLIVQIPE
jgi:hypothetical protein